MNHTPADITPTSRKSYQAGQYSNARNVFLTPLKNRCSLPSHRFHKFPKNVKSLFSRRVAFPKNSVSTPYEPPMISRTSLSGRELMVILILRNFGSRSSDSPVWRFFSRMIWRFFITEKKESAPSYWSLTTLWIRLISTLSHSLFSFW